MWVGVEHLQKFAKINLANLVIWQLAKIYAKLKRRLSPRVCHLGLVKLKGGPQKKYLINYRFISRRPFLSSPVPPVAARRAIVTAASRIIAAIIQVAIHCS